ncbi:DUF1697 domain-containing protein [Gordonia otitidis]|uniref:DUF1697 domain-containing protein n=1 Tax=Gordonia otitidis TaxID=249058 RepID=UPI001D1591D2|nr:DUF1697 domain-containing protein [Gordonia otitidis]UEA61198.1 DUF1697 domain-containing protein [Gordonia otitidis]
MTRRAVMIRAINVGGAQVPMKELRSIARDLGATDVATYIASGNLICTPPASSHHFDRALEAAIEQRYGFFREVISRSRAELIEALDRHPFDIVDDKFSYVYFLVDSPPDDRLKAFSDKTFGDDVYQVIGSDLHIRYAEGAGTSKLTAPVIARGLGVQGTGRNLRTVRKLIEMTA